MGRSFKPALGITLGIVTITGAALFVMSRLPGRAGGEVARPTALRPVDAATSKLPRVSSEALASDRIPAEFDPGEERGPVAGRVLDARTHQPLPWFDLTVENMGDASEALRSDAEGRFLTASSFDAGDLLIGFADRQEAPKSPFDDRFRRFEARPGGDFVEQWRPGREITVEAEIGPIFRLRLAPEPIGPAPGFVVRLSTGSASNVSQILGGGFTNRRGWSVVTPLRRSNGTWARFPPIDRRVANNGPWRLSVESADGLWYGETKIESIEGSQTQSIALAPLAHVTIAVVGPGARPEQGVEMDLIRIGSQGEQLRREHWVSDAQDRRFGQLPAGEYLLSAGSLRHDRAERRLTLVGGEDAEVELMMRRLPYGGTISGSLVSATGSLRRHSRVANIRLHYAGQRKVLATANPWWHRLGEDWVCSFQFDDLPEGEYELSVFSLQGRFAWEPARVHVSPPVKRLVFTRRDDRPTEDLELEVLDSNGKPARDLKLAYWVAGGDEMISHGSATVAMRRVAIGVDVEWALWAPGHRPERGTRAAFSVSDGTRRVAHRQLRAGWGTRIEARSDAPGDEGPLAGVIVTIDGRRAGITNAEGYLDVESHKMPEQVTVSKPGWSPSSLGPFQLAGRPNALFPRYEILMRPLRGL